jgi:hypothetical protein
LGLQSFCPSDIQRFRNPENGLDARVADTALDAADVGAIEVGSFGELVLREFPPGADPGDISTEGNEGPVTHWHVAHHVRNLAPASVDYRLQCSSRIPGQPEGAKTRVWMADLTQGIDLCRPFRAWMDLETVDPGRRFRCSLALGCFLSGLRPFQSEPPDAGCYGGDSGSFGTQSFSPQRTHRSQRKQAFTQISLRSLRSFVVNQSVGLDARQRIPTTVNGILPLTPALSPDGGEGVAYPCSSVSIRGFH